MFLLGPESRLCPSSPVSLVDGRQFYLSAVLDNTSIQFIDFSYMKGDDDLIIRLSLDQARRLLGELHQVLIKSQKLNDILVPPTLDILENTNHTPTVSSIIERGLTDPNYKIEERPMQSDNNWNKSPFQEDPSPSEVLQSNQLPKIKRSNQAVFTQQHLEICIQAIREPGVELVPSVLCPSEYLEELLLKGFDNRSIITSEIYKTLKEKKINYIKGDLREVLDRLVEEKKVKKQERVSKNQREYTVYTFGKGQKKRNTLTEQLEAILLSFNEELFRKEDFMQETETKQIDPEVAEKFFEERKQEGDILEPEGGKFKYLKD